MKCPTHREPSQPGGLASQLMLITGAKRQGKESVLGILALGVNQLEDGLGMLVMEPKIESH